jgi:hypothetical protein
MLPHCGMLPCIFDSYFAMDYGLHDDPPIRDHRRPRGSIRLSPISTGKHDDKSNPPNMHTEVAMSAVTSLVPGTRLFSFFICGPRGEPRRAWPGDWPPNQNPLDVFFSS